MSLHRCVRTPFLKGNGAMNMCAELAVRRTIVLVELEVDAYVGDR